MKKLLLAVFLPVLILSLSYTTILAQDFGQILEAVDKIETNLKTMVKKETATRIEEISKLRAELEKLQQSPSSGGDNAEFAALKAKVEKLSQAGGNSSGSQFAGIDDLKFMEIQHNIDLLRDEVLSIASTVNNGIPTAASSDGSDYRDLKNEIAWLKLEIRSLRAHADASTQEFASVAEVATRPASSSSASKKSAPGPKYHNLRFQDNYSYLNNSSNRGNDLFDVLKRQPIGSNAEISFGGHYRVRYESDNNRKLGASTPLSQEVYLNRLFLFGDFKVSDRFRLFAEFKWAGIKNNELPAGAIAHDRPDIENLFVDGWVLTDKSFKLGARVGRQELQFGKQRLVSPLDWANTRRTFEGFRIMSKFNSWSIDAFITRPVTAKPEAFNTPDLAHLFSGIYSSGKLGGNTLSAYFLVFTKNAPVSLTTGLSGDFEYLTLGTGYDGKGGRFDWSTEAAYQFGSLGADKIAAYMISLNGGYTYKSHPIKPRIGLSWDLASGDSDPTDNKVKTFHQQFPLGHAYFGWADQVGRRNINSASVQLSAHPSKIITTKLNWFSFNLAQKEDALYNAGGKASRQDATGASGSHIGNELDALVILKLNRHASFHIGYTHFKPGGFIKNTGTSESHNMLYMMLPIKF